MENAFICVFFFLYIIYIFSDITLKTETFIVEQTKNTH